MQRAFGSNHIRYTGGDDAIRLTTDAPLSYIDRESPFVLTRPLHLVFGADTPFEGDLATTCREFSDRTRDYWQEWIRRLAISYEWQDAVIRAAITLKLSSFEETGAIIAAHTTSIPEAPGSGRTWDYRFCWLRDAYFVVRALNRIGATRTMEDYISYILTIVTGHDRRTAAGLQHRLDRSAGRAHRRRPEGLSRRRAGAHRQCGGRAEPARHLRQRDPRGDADVLRPAAAAHGRREPVPPARAARRNGARSSRSSPMPASGNTASARRIHTHSVAMCWAGCQRLEAIAAHLGLDDRAAYWGAHAATIRAEMLEKAWNPKRGAFTAAFGSDDLDASVLLLPELGAIEATDPRFVSTVNAIERELKRDLQRYALQQC